MILLSSENIHWLKLELFCLMKISFFLSVSLDSGKDESQMGLNQKNKQFKVTIMDFSHQLYGCVNTGVVCPFSEKALRGHFWTVYSAVIKLNTVTNKEWENIIEVV